MAERWKGWWKMTRKEFSAVMLAAGVVMGLLAGDGAWAVLTYQISTIEMSGEWHYGYPGALSTRRFDISVVDYGGPGFTCENPDEVLVDTEGYVGAGEADRSYDLAAPEPPRLVDASDGLYSDKVLVQWTAVSESSEYRVYRAELMPGPRVPLCEWLARRSFSDSTAEQGKTYYYWVRTKDSAGVSHFGRPDQGWVPAASGTNMVSIPAGEFEMGDHDDEMYWSLPVHTVYVDSFYMSKYQVTNQRYCDYLNSGLSQGLIEVRDGVVYASGGGTDPYCDMHSCNDDSQIDYSDGAFTVRAKDDIDMLDHPMVQVSWYGSAAYCNWMSQQDGYEQCYDPGAWDCDFTKKGYRLATEAEREYAARGGEHDPYYAYPWGDDMDGSKANYLDSGDRYETGDYPWTTPVGYYDGNQIPAGEDMANGYGLYDMTGNVWEWCNDWYSSSYYASRPTRDVNPTGPTGGLYRVLRSCGWGGADNYGYCRVSNRLYAAPSERHSDGGFRLVLDLE